MKTTITKLFKFYAAHRNEEIGGKCASWHGHRYGLKVTVCEPRNGSITMLFEDIEKIVDPIVANIDHSMIINEKDPDFDEIVDLESVHKTYRVPFVTSCENIAEHLFVVLKENGLNVVELSLQETDSSIVTVSE